MARESETSRVNAEPCQESATVRYRAMPRVSYSQIQGHAKRVRNRREPRPESGYHRAEQTEGATPRGGRGACVACAPPARAYSSRRGSEGWGERVGVRGLG
eukprot:5847410-Prymnesium_polylepis.1